MAPSTQLATQLIPSFDELLDDGDFSFTMPPLRSTLPSSPPERLDVLEPSANPQADEQSSRLKSRQMALAQAQPMEPPSLDELDTADCLTSTAGDDMMAGHALDLHHRKRRKLAHEERVVGLVTLPKPKPTAKLDDANKKPFRPIAVLNQLHEPPPSAALFPPITADHDLQQDSSADHATHKNDTSAEKDGPVEHKRPSVKAKRLRLRRRHMWTQEETNDLLEGVAIIGMGRWKDILRHPKFHFQEFRTPVDLKDRFRTLFPQAQPERWGDAGKQLDHNGERKTKRSKTRKGVSNDTMAYRNWTEAEDAELRKGFHQHGFKWHLIARDEGLEFDHRTAAQIRDRFRRIHPHIYEGVPPPNPQSLKPKRGRGRPRGTTKKKTEICANPPDEMIDHAESVNDADKDAILATTAMPAPAFLHGLLNNGYHETESEFSKSLAEFDNHLENAIDDGLRLPPLQWDEMAVQPIFDIQ